MLTEIQLNFKDLKETCNEIINYWKLKDNKVFVLRSNGCIENVKQFYDDLLPKLGKSFFLAEDANISNRQKQRNGELWSEVRFDPNYQDAYRHSSNSQPLHTDGSYIPSFPNASLMCCIKNDVEGGETVFLDSTNLVECLEVENKEMLKSLLLNEVVHSRSGDTKKEKVISVINNTVFLNWNYYCLERNNKGELISLFEEFFEYLKNSKLVKNHLLEVRMGIGDAVIWKDKEVLHGRKSFNASVSSSRHLCKCAIDVGNFINEI